MKTVVFDIETTGLPPKNADYKTQFMDFPYIVTMAYKINEEETKEFIINQEGREIPAEATAIHGITNEMATASPHKIMDVIGIFILDAKESDLAIGHNIYFDSSIIKANILRKAKNEEAIVAFYTEIELILHKDRRIDTMKSTIKFCNLPGAYGPKWPKLTELYSKLFNETFEAHSSKNDVDATHKCYHELKRLGVL